LLQCAVEALRTGSTPSSTATVIEREAPEHASTTSASPFLARSIQQAAFNPMVC
jgi:hypothetical protein